MRSALLLLSIPLAGFAVAQGNFGGSLQQGRQGPLGGDGRSDERPGYQEPPPWTARKATLTPRDRVEFKITANREQAFISPMVGGP